jgi:hypothetical protein
MHGMFKRAAVSVIPVLLGLAVFPATAMAAPHTGRAVAGPARSGRETHERLAQRPRLGMHQGHRAGTTSIAGTPADDPAINWGIAFYWAPRPVNGGDAYGIIAYGNDDKIINDNVYANAGAGIDNSDGATVGNAAVGISGNPSDDDAAVAGRPDGIEADVSGDNVSGPAPN